AMSEGSMTQLSSIRWARWAARLAAGAAAALTIAALLSCVSDRSTGPVVDLEGCNVQLPTDAFGSTIVVIRDFAFAPAQVHVRPGTKVTWVNCGDTGTPAHTSTADGGAWSSPLLAPGAVFTHEFTTAGEFPYHCEPHPFMTGTVTVE
ncbi:MAG TPA: plastocyanin/azurin family copper-binding protein, partial [Gemmatimonadaceae bacterium]|nr:plastocyanin/azurin family copper-binding protein [Gemmatimonadaceae bacterium]